MADLRINSDAVVVAANNIKSLNGQIRDGFGSVKNAINKLNNTWDGGASDSAISKFNEIESNYCNARYNVMNDYVFFLLQQVGEGYTNTEAVNVSLADQFK